MWILASKSPRRRAILQMLGQAFEVESADIDENGIHLALRREAGGGEIDPALLVSRLAAAKGEAVLARRLNATKIAETPFLQEDWIIISADTVVALDGVILGKPRDEDDAVAMLRRLAGRTHTVYTGVCILRAGKKENPPPIVRQAFVSTAEVRFLPLDDYLEKFIRDYAASGIPLDKAGAYGIQDIGAALVERIDGDFYTVMGLPFAALRKALFT